MEVRPLQSVQRGGMEWDFNGIWTGLFYLPIGLKGNFFLLFNPTFPGLESLYGPKYVPEKPSIPQERVGYADLRTSEIQILADHPSRSLQF